MFKDLHPTYCPITGLEFHNLEIHESYYKYILNINKHNYLITLSINKNWDEFVKPEDKLIFIGMFYNNEWPIEPETIITFDLIQQIIHFGEYPRNFDEKLDYYLLSKYLDGGKEYKELIFIWTDYSQAYAKSPEEFKGIIRGLVLKGFLTEIENYFLFTEKGIERGKELLDKRNNDVPKKNNSIIKKLRVSIYGVKEDANYYDKLRNILLQDYGFTVSGEIINTHTRVDFQNLDVDYVIFLQSNNSVKNTNFISIVTQASIFHKTSEKRFYNFLLFAFLDLNMDYDNRPPYMNDYLEGFFDFRIVTNRKNLVKYILKDWDKKTSLEKNLTQPISNNKEDQRIYNLPRINITKHEKIWLEAVYEKFLNNEKFKYHHLLAELGDKVPNNFDPLKIDPALIRSGTDITILGIWHANSKSNLVEKFDMVVYAIQKLLEKYNKSISITSDQIKEEIPDITFFEIQQIFTLLSSIDGFSCGNSWNYETQHSTLKVDEDYVFRNYRQYNGIEKLISSQIQGSDDNDSLKAKPESLDQITNRSKLDAYRARISIKETQIKPVMGVVELAADLASIIQTLPEEKGQMFGIFGKWGRGKTFLLGQLWENLSKSKEKKYIKLEYHAWKYQETPASWAYLYKLFVESYLGKKSNSIGGNGYLCRLLKLNIERLGWLPIIKFGLAFIGVFVLSPLLYILGTIYKDWYILSPIPFLFIPSIITLVKSNQDFSIKTFDLIKKYSIKHDFNKSLGIQAEIQDELIKLLKVWIPENETSKTKILLLVEDIDRCTEDRIIQSIDALRIMLEENEILKRVIIVTAIDERILKNAIKIKYKSLINSQILTKQKEDKEVVKIHELISEYLDKVFISAIRLGELTNEYKKEYLDELLKEDVGEDIIKEADLIAEKDVLLNNLEEFIPEITKKVSFNPNDFGSAEEISAINEFFKQNETQEFDLAIDKGDFVLKDNDIAMRDKNGKIVSQKDIDDRHKYRIDQQKKFEKLTTTEFIILKETIINWKSATPRKIRILYYRYLLCKNLLINSYTSKFNLWQNEPGIKILMNRILYYSNLHKPEIISQEKIETISKRQEKNIVQDGMSIPKQDYLFLLEALEMVIAY